MPTCCTPAPARLWIVPSRSGFSSPRPNLDQPLALTLVILAGAVVLLVSDRVRPDLVALLTAALLGVSGVLSPQEAFAGFGSRAVITLLAVGILAEGLTASGVADRAGRLMLRISGSREKRLTAVVMVSGALVSLFMNNIAAAAVLLPATAAATRRAGLPPSRIMMPLAFGTILGGMATLLTSSNLIVSDLLTDAGYPGFGLFDFAPVGIPLIVAGTAYMLLWGRRRLPVGGPSVPGPTVQAAVPGRANLAPAPPTEEGLPDLYRLGERTHRAQIRPDSELAGRTLADSGIRERLGLTVTGIQRGRALYTNPPAGFRLRERDVLELMGRPGEDSGIELKALLEPMDAGEVPRPAGPTDTVMAEAVLPPRSPLQGRTLKEVRFGDRFGLQVLAIWRGDHPIRSGIADLPLALGDALLVQGPPNMVTRARRQEELIILGGLDLDPEPTRGRARAAMLILALSLGVGALHPPAVGAILLLGALAMVLLNVLTMDGAHHAIDWRTIFLVAGMLPLGLALERSGVASLAADALVRGLGPLGPMALLTGLFLAAALLTQAVVGPAVAAMVGPVAIQAAVQTGLDPRAMGLAVALACSMAFLTPLGHPVSVLVMGPGGYRFADYRRVGLPMAIVLVVVVLLVLPRVFPLAG
jgi:di/tricarboxylate transporter